MKKTQQPQSKAWVLVRMPKPIRVEIEKRAEKEGRSLSQQVLQYIKRGLVEHAHD